MAVLHELHEAGAKDVHLVVGRQGRGYVVHVLGLAGHERVVGHRELVVHPEDEHGRVVLLRLVVEGVLARHRRWKATVNRKLVRLGLSPMP